jgi:hypothetical protein
VHAAEFDCHKRLVADHPRVVPRWDLERLAGAKNSPRAGVGFDLYFAFEDNALVMVLAAGRPGHWFHVLGPAPPRLVDEAGDVRLAEKHDLNGYERKRDELIRLVESPRLEPRPAGLLAGTFAAKGSTVRDTEAHQYWARQLGHPKVS